MEEWDCWSTGEARAQPTLASLRLLQLAKNPLRSSSAMMLCMNSEGFRFGSLRVSCGSRRRH